MKKVLAFDLGASSGRAITATIDGGKIKLNEVHRFSNNGVNVNGTLYWDILYLFNEIKQGIVQAKLNGGFDAIGIDTWGVDFGLIDAHGDLIGNPVHYRDGRTDNIPEEVYKTVKKSELYKKTGISVNNFNSLFQLYYLAKNRPDILDRTDKMLFIPDLLNYFLTGVKKSEYTIASTSQMLDPYIRNWDKELLSQLGINTNILCDIVQPGTIIGNLSGEICEELEVDSIPVIAVGAHDTASAVVSVPATEKEFVYISCGTWSLFGTELAEPNVSEKAFESAYTNEGGCGKTIRFLTNIMGLWLIQESRRAWKKQGYDLSFYDLEQAARKCSPMKCFINPDSPEFAKPGNMPKHIQEFCKRTGQYVPQTIGEIVRCIYESLAMKYRYAYFNLKDITGKGLGCINIVGGGTKDPFLCQMTADACNVKVMAGPIEATAMGNIALQLISLGEIDSIAQAREIIHNSFEVKEYIQQNPGEWDKAYETFKQIL